jgi:hypothetical protein
VEGGGWRVEGRKGRTGARLLRAPSGVAGSTTIAGACIGTRTCRDATYPPAAQG